MGPPWRCAPSPQGGAIRAWGGPARSWGPLRAARRPPVRERAALGAARRAHGCPATPGGWRRCATARRFAPPEIKIHEFHESRRAILTTTQAPRALDNDF